MDRSRATETATPASAMQVGLLVENELADVRDVNIVQIVGNIDEPLRPASFALSWNHVITEFDVLRMSLHVSARGNVEARFQPRADFECEFDDWSGISVGEAEALFHQKIETRRQSSAECSRAPSMHLDYLRFTPQHWRFVWTFHHSLLEGFSIYLIIKRLFEVYKRLCCGETPEKKHQPRFRDFLEWSAQRDCTDGLEYFRDLLAGFERPTVLPFSRRIQQEEELPAGLVTANLSTAETSEFESAARQLEVTPNTIVQFCWGLLLSRYSGDPDVVFGATWTLRGPGYSESKRTAGLLINTTPVRLCIEEKNSVRTEICRLRAQHMRTKPFRHTPTTAIRTECFPRSNQPLFRSVVVFDYQRFSERLTSLGGDWVNRSFYAIQKTGNPLTVEASFLDGRLSVAVEYGPGLLKKRQATRLTEDYLRLLKNVTEDLDCTVAEVRMLSDSAFRKLVTKQVSREKSENPPDIVDSIQQTIDSFPDKTAIEDPDGKSISYAELDLASRQVAHELHARGAVPGSIAAILMPRSIDAIVGMLGALRAGVAFLPVDPQYPDKRVRYMLDDSKAQFILVSGASNEIVPCTDSQIIQLDSLPKKLESDVCIPRLAESLAYVIYTSGSTGNPKGVCIPRSAIANHCQASKRLFELETGDRVLQFMSFSFDASLEEIFPTLCAGSTLVLRHEDSATTSSRFFDEIERRHISVMNIPTAFWHGLVVHKGANDWPSSLRLLIIGGEKAFDKIYRQFREQNTSHIRFINSYGPTEATVTSTVYDDCSIDCEAALPIGKPIDSVSHFVLDSSMRAVPEGEVGQLFIGGAGLATGYLGRADLTAASFFPHPFNEGARLYATGDLVFVTEDGNFCYINRSDSQIKVRGFRIEPGEIEAHLVSLPHVAEAAVVPYESGNQGSEIEAHVVVTKGSVNATRLREALSKRVPSHLVPARFHFHTSLPKTVSGKVDRQRLTDLTTPGGRSSEVTAPKASRRPSLFEGDVREIWAELFKLTDANDDMDFFDSGGDSLRLLQLFAEIEHRTRQEPSATTFLRRPTLGHIIQLVENERFNRIPTLLTKMNNGDSAVRPLFLAPGVCGVAVDFVNLVNALDPSIPVFGLQIDEIGDDAETALHGFAERSVAEILQTQKEGPYGIAGYSAGAIIALEISQMLLEKGLHVDFVGILDAVPPYSVERSSPFSGPARFSSFAISVFRRAMSQTGDTHSGFGWLIRRMRPSVIWRYAAWAKTENEAEDVAELLNLKKSDVGDHLLAKWQRTLNAVNSYRHKELSTDIVLFRTATAPVEGPHEPDLGWGKVGTKNIFIEHLPGTHSEILTTKTAPTLARLMEIYLLDRRES